MHFLHLILVLLTSPTCFTGPIEDLGSMPDLTLFYQQLIRQQDLQMLLQGVYPQQQMPGGNEFTIFAPNNEAMERFNRKMEDPNLLLKYHIVPGRYDEQTLYKMAQDKFSEINPRQPMAMRTSNNLPTVAQPFQLFFGFGFYGGTGPQVNDTHDNAGYGTGGISWLTHTSFNQTNLFDNFLPLNPYKRNRHARNYFSTGQINPNFTHHQNVNSRFLQQSSPNFGTWSVNNGIGALRPTVNNAFILQSRPMSRGVINVIDQILWPPERRDHIQYKTVFDALEDPQFSRLRQLAERSEYFRSELRSMHHQTWFLPNDQAFATMGSMLAQLLDQSLINNTNEINDFIRAHALPIVLYPNVMDSTKQVVTLRTDKWVTFRKVSHPDQSFQIDVIAGRHTARILVSRPEEIRLAANGVVYPISSVLTSPMRSAADELTRNYQYFMNLVQQSGDLELINILQGMTNANVYNSQPLFNITILVPQQTSIQQLGNSQDLSMNLRRHIIRFPVYIDQLTPSPASSQPYLQQNPFPNGPQTQPIMPTQQQPAFSGQQQPSFMPPGFNNQQQQSQYEMPQFQRTATGSYTQLPRRRRQMNPTVNTNFQNQQYFPQQFPSPQQPTQQQFLNQQLPAQQPFPNQQQPTQQQFPNPQQPTQQQFPNQQQPTQQQFPNPQQQQFPNQQQPTQQQFQNPQQQLPNRQQPIFPSQPQQPNPNAYPMPFYPQQAVFQHGQVYPTMDPQFSVQAQILAGPNGNIVTLFGRSSAGAPFTATILNDESNIPLRNGVMHVIRGLLSGTIVSLESILPSIQGASTFGQLLQQTGVFEQLRRTGGRHTLFIPTNAALQSIGLSNNVNQLRQFVLRHICGDVLLDPSNNAIRRSAGFYNREQTGQPLAARFREKRQEWMNMRRNGTAFFNRQGVDGAPNLGSGYFQTQQQAYGGYPAAPTPFGSNNQLYNSAYMTNGYGRENSPYATSFNGTMMNNQPLATVMSHNQWNLTMNNVPDQRQGAFSMNYPGQNRYPNVGKNIPGSIYMSGPQSCLGMTGERITVQSLRGTQPEGNAPTLSYQNFIVTCCGDQSINSLVQSYNVYPPNVAIYLIGRPLLSQGQTITNLSNKQSKHVSCYFLLIVLLISIIFMKTNNH